MVNLVKYASRFQANMIYFPPLITQIVNKKGKKKQKNDLFKLWEFQVKQRNKEKGCY